MENTNGFIKEEIVGAVKKTALYKLLKTSEAVLVLGVLGFGLITGWFDVIPAVALMVGYAVINIAGLSNEPLYVLRDKVVDKTKTGI